MASSTMSTPLGPIAIIGSGLIGRSWAMVFASAGHKVSIYDILPEQVQAALADILRQLKELEADDLLRGSLTAEQIHGHIAGYNDMGTALKGAVYVQECVPESVDIKRQVFLQVEPLVGPDTILASSSSAIPASTFTDTLTTSKANTLVAHPVNPPYHMPLVELVPAPWTSPEVVTRARALLKSVGQTPVTLNKEVPGFVQPRIQYALIQECLKLVLNDVISVEDVDKILTDGMGMRYSFMGPFETIHLNAEGVNSYLERYADMIYEVASDSGPMVRLHDDPRMASAFEQLNDIVPLGDLAARRAWRDKGVAALNKMRNQMDSQ